MNNTMKELAKAAQKANKLQSYDLGQIYRDYAKEIGRENLTALERQQALANHIFALDQK